MFGRKTRWFRLVIDGVIAVWAGFPLAMMFFHSPEMVALIVPHVLWGIVQILSSRRRMSRSTMSVLPIHSFGVRVPR